MVTLTADHHRESNFPISLISPGIDDVADGTKGYGNKVQVKKHVPKSWMMEIRQVTVTIPRNFVGLCLIEQVNCDTEQSRLRELTTNHGCSKEV